MKQLTDEYQLLRQIGRGGMGEVWAGSRSGPQGMWMTCAVKLLHREMAETPRDLQMFLNEARIASQLDHSRIVKVFDVGSAADGAPFIVMEWVDGVNLRTFTDAAQKHGFWPLELDIVTYIIGEILAALEYAHDRTVGGMDAGVIHYDVTPGNIMISSSGEVKLTDFGIARFAANAGPLSRSIGTPRYMSPEQITGYPRRETDIYSLGVVLHELLDGRRYLEGYGQNQFQAQVLLGAAPELSRTDVPAWLDDLRRRMLANRAEQRPSARAVRTVLVDNCPRYMIASEELKNRYYPRLIGRKRSGMTELLDVGAIEVAVRKAMLGASPKPMFSAEPQGADVPVLERRSGNPSPVEANRSQPAPPVLEPARPAAPSTLTASRRDQLRLANAPALADELIEPTEELPVEEVSRAKQLVALARAPLREEPGDVTESLAPVFAEPTEDSARTRSAAHMLAAGPARPVERVRRPIPWARVGSFAAILLLSLLSLTLLIEISRRPAVVESASKPEPAVAEPEQISPNPVTVASADPPTSPSVALEPPLSEAESGSSESGSSESGSSESGSSESEAVEQGAAKQAAPRRPAKLPPAAKVGVTFVFDVERGRIEIAGRSHPVSGYTSYVEVSSGKKYTMRLEPAGASAWQTIGKLDAKPIAPAGYVVSFQKGKLSVDERKGGTR